MNNMTTTPIANACDHDKSLWFMSFGAYGDTHLYVWADSVEDALEEAFEWLDDNAPGILSKIERDEYETAARELNLKIDTEDEGEQERIREHAEIDMTMCSHTTLKNGNAISSSEWFIIEVYDMDEHVCVRSEAESESDE